MESRTVTFNRWFVGILAVGCFVAAAWIWVAAPEEQYWRFWWGGCLRGGVVLAALWACLPTKTRPAAWASFSPLSATLFAAAVLLTILRPKIGLLLLLAVIAARVMFSRFSRRR
jgi:hypothetical protein